jgi:hypothetical protein
MFHVEHWCFGLLTRSRVAHPTSLRGSQGIRFLMGRHFYKDPGIEGARGMHQSRIPPDRVLSDAKGANGW